MTANPPASAPRIGRFPATARPIVVTLWLLCLLAALGAQIAGLWLAAEMDASLVELLMQLGPGLLATAALLTAAVLLMRRDPGDPVGVMLSLSSIAAGAYVGAAPILYAVLETELPETILPSLWVGLLVAALPAFPDGRYVPGWGRWLTVLAIPFTIIISADALVDDEAVVLATTIIGFGTALTALAAAVIRFRRTPPGLEKQQLKWAALGVGLCIVTLIGAIALSYADDAGLFPEEWLPWLQITILTLRDLSFVILAAGLLVSVLRLRLWDADRAIGRSAAYFILTVFIACLWAVSSTLVNDFVSNQVGGGNKGVSAALSTVIAMLAFGPARDRVNKWVEKRLQRGVVQLRGLPDRLAVWQSLDDPEAFGARLATTITRSLHAGRCAVLLFEDERFHPLAWQGASRPEVEAWMTARGSFADLDYEAPDDADFPLRLILTDEDVLIGALLVGRRSDGSFYAKEERATLLGLEPPLAAALHRVQQRVTTRRALAGFDARLGRVEAAVGP